MGGKMLDQPGSHDTPRCCRLERRTGSTCILPDMDSLVASAARALAAGDPLGALKRVALRDDPPAFALRGIAMAQLGDYERARKLLRRAARGFGTRERLAQARCQVAEAEVALAARDLSGPVRALDAAAQALDALGDRANALYARLVGARRQLLVGDLEAAEQTLARVDVDAAGAPPPLAARAELTRAELALRRVRVADAAAALGRAHAAALAAGIPALVAEIGRARRALSAPSARLIRGGVVRSVRLDEVEALFASGDLVVDGCRRAVRGPARSVSLAGRPVLFALVGALAEAWPADVPRDRLVERAFEARAANESHRARLRVEVGRLRAALRPLARIEATRRGFALVPVGGRAVVVLAPPIDGPAGAILALLEGGESWSTSALACALGASQRTVQRALRQLEEAAAVRAVGRGRSRRWLAPALGGFATTLLLPGALPVG
jgi:DNA-binding transcriptional ArsR family regulator